MNKDWKDIVKEKIDVFNTRKNNIDNTLKNLLKELQNLPYNMGVNSQLIDEENLVWQVEIGKQKFLIEEEEIAQKQKQAVEYQDEYGFTNKADKIIDLRDALINIIIEKIK